MGTRSKGANVENMPLGNRSRRKDILQPFRIFYSLPLVYIMVRDPPVSEQTMRDTLRPYRAIAGAVTQGYPESLHQPRGPAPATPGARISGLVASPRTHRPIPETSRGMRPSCHDLSCCTTAPQIWGQPRGVHPWPPSRLLRESCGSSVTTGVRL